MDRSAHPFVVALMLATLQAWSQTQQPSPTEAGQHTAALQDRDLAVIVASADLPIASPVGLAIGNVGDIYFGDNEAHEIVRFDLRQQVVRWRVPFPRGRVACLEADSTTVWAAGLKTHELHRFDAQTGRLLGTWKLPLDNPSGMASADGMRWICDYEEPMLFQVSPNSGEVRGEQPLPCAGLTGIAFSRGRLWATLGDERRLVAIDLQRRRITCEVALPVESPAVRGLVSRGRWFYFIEWPSPGRLDAVELSQETWRRAGGRFW